MKIQIKHRWTSKVLFELEAKDNSMKLTIEVGVKSGSNLSYSDLSGSNLSYSNLRGSNLSYSDLSGSDLRGSNLSGSDLSYSDLSGSNLRGSNLSYSDLSGSNLRGSNLRGSNLRGSNLRYGDLSGSEGHYPKLYADNLSLLKLQPPKTRLLGYKHLNGDISPYQSFKYEVGKTYECKDIKTDETILCGEGINLATLEWCLRATSVDLDKTYIECEFLANDIVVPFNTDGKFRVSKMKIVRKLTNKQIGCFLEKGSLK